MDIKILSQIDPSIVEYPEDLTEKDQDNSSIVGKMADLFVTDPVSSVNQPVQLPGKSITANDLFTSPVPVTKEHVYEVSTLYAFLEEMKQNSFNPYLDIVPRHHFRYSTQVVSKTIPIYNEYVNVNKNTNIFLLICREEVSIEWDLPDVNSDTFFDITVCSLHSSSCIGQHSHRK